MEFTPFLGRQNTTNVGHFQKVLTSIGNFCICSIDVGMVIEIIVIYGIHGKHYRNGIDNLIVLLIGGIPITMPTVLSITMVIDSHKLAQQGAITKRMTAIEEMSGMDVLCSDKTRTLTLNKLSVDRNIIEVFVKNFDKDMVILMAARASRLENQDAIDYAIVSMLADQKVERAGIEEVHFLPFNPTNKRTALTYIDATGKMHRVSKGAPVQILNLTYNKSETQQRVHAIIEKFVKCGLRSLVVARQEVLEGTKDSPGEPWEFVGLLPLFHPPRQAMPMHAPSTLCFSMQFTVPFKKLNIFISLVSLIITLYSSFSPRTSPLSSTPYLSHCQFLHLTDLNNNYVFHELIWRHQTRSTEPCFHVLNSHPCI